MECVRCSHGVCSQRRMVSQGGKECFQLEVGTERVCWPLCGNVPKLLLCMLEMIYRHSVRRRRISSGGRPVRAAASTWTSTSRRIGSGFCVVAPSQGYCMGTSSEPAPAPAPPLTFQPENVVTVALEAVSLPAPALTYGIFTPGAARTTSMQLHHWHWQPASRRRRTS